MLIKTLFKESDHGSYRVEIHKNESGDFLVDYYSPSGMIKSETIPNSNINLIEISASKWIDGIQVLKG
jgi:hypothetical protein